MDQKLSKIEKELYVKLKLMHCKVLKKSECDPRELHFQAGDFILTHGDSIFDRLIQLMTMNYWNHTALIVDSKGGVIELVDDGIRKNNLSKYKDEEVFIVKTEFSNQNRKEVLDYAFEMLRRHQKYGILQIISIGFKILTKSRLIVKFDGTQICSEFVANALARGGVVWETDTSLVTPADVYNKIVKGKTEAILH